MTLEIFNKDECVFNFGEVGDKFYIILEGKLSVLIPTKTKSRMPVATKTDFHNERLFRSLTRHNTIRRSDSKSKITEIMKKNSFDFDFLGSVGEIEQMQEIKTLQSGDSFGELALLSNQPRSATIICKENSYFAVLSQQDYKIILSSNARKSILEKFEFLQQLHLFKGLSRNSIKNLAYLVTESTYKKNQIVYNDKITADDLYFIKTGEFKITVKEQLDNKEFNGYSTSPLKLKMQRKNGRVIDHQIVIKGKNEIFGYEIITGDEKIKNHTSTCISNFGIVYVINLNVIFS